MWNIESEQQEENDDTWEEEGDEDKSDSEPETEDTSTYETYDFEVVIRKTIKAYDLCQATEELKNLFNEIRIIPTDDQIKVSLKDLKENTII